MVFPHWPSFDIGIFHVYSSHWQGVQETQFIAACGPPGGGRMPVGTPISLLFGNVDVANLHPSECWTEKNRDAQIHGISWIFVVFFWGQNHFLGGSQVTSIRPTTWDASLTPLNHAKKIPPSKAVCWTWAPSLGIILAKLWTSASKNANKKGLQ